MSSLSAVEHVHLGVLVSNLIASSDDESDEMDYQELMESPVEVMLSTSGSYEKRRLESYYKWHLFLCWSRTSGVLVHSGRVMEILVGR